MADLEIQLFQLFHFLLKKKKLQTWRRNVLDERLKQVLCQDLRVASQDATPELLVSDVLQRSTQQDG